MKWTAVSEVEYSPQMPMGGDPPMDDPQSVQEWLGECRKRVAMVAKELADVAADGQPIGISIRLEGRRAIITGQIQTSSEGP